jgi:hypothetical protein
LEIIYFENITDGLDYQIKFCTDFCDNIFSSIKPNINYNTNMILCKILIGNNSLYLLTNNKEYVDFGRRYYLEVIK